MSEDRLTFEEFCEVATAEQIQKLLNEGLNIDAVHPGRREVLLTNGHIIPIETLIDHEGDETDDFDEAVTAVAGRGCIWFKFETWPLEPTGTDWLLFPFLN